MPKNMMEPMGVVFQDQDGFGRSFPGAKMDLVMEGIKNDA